MKAMRVSRIEVRMQPLILKTPDSASRTSACWNSAVHKVAFARQYDRPVISRSDPGAQSVSLSIGLVAKGLVSRVESAGRPTRSDRCPHPTRQGSHCFRLSKAFRADEESVLRTKPGGASSGGLEAALKKKVGKPRCRADRGELSGRMPVRSLGPSMKRKSGRLPMPEVCQNAMFFVPLWLA